MPETSIPKDAAYQIINDELMLDGNPQLNLASNNLSDEISLGFNNLRSTSLIIKANSSSKLSLMGPASRPAVVIDNGSGKLCSNM
ncbi:hypothetical protein ACFX13_013503 [Malus domestica]